jgi:FkbM family methyltransferase
MRCVCDLRNELVREVYFSGKYEPQETGLLRRILAPGNVFVDVGANWGYFSLLAARAVGAGGRIVALECDPRIYPVLERNIALNELGCERPLQVAAADVCGSLTLRGYDASQSNWGISRVSLGTKDPSGTFYSVKGAPLDQILDDLQVGTVDCVKMDIEGAEVLALRGMTAGLHRHRYRSLLLELHSHQIRELGHEVADVITLLTGAGYRGFTIDHSPAATRRAAYSVDADPVDYLRPFEAQRPLDAWPHMLWTAPGFEASFLPRLEER